jgi:DNA-binding MarR family transcriptional regulator
MPREPSLAETARSLRAALSRLNRRLRAEDDGDGVGSTGLSLLGRLLRDGPSSASALATRERLQPQSLTRTLQSLEKRHLIDRAADTSDRRRSTITITPAGIDVLRRSVLTRESWLARAILSTLSPTERDLLRITIPLLDRLADADADAPSPPSP